jgi:hypothetical protein
MSKATNEPVSSAKLYWTCYGGWGALFRSIYFRVSLIAPFFLSPYWVYNAWWNEIPNLLPSMLGVTIGGYAIFIAVGDPKFLKILAKAGKASIEGKSVLLRSSASFVHFVVFQIISIFIWLILNAVYSDSVNMHAYEFVKIHANVGVCCKFLIFMLHYFGFAIFVYSILCVLALVMNVFRVIYWFDRYAQRQ